MAEQKLLGKRAIVTGGATGIGYGIAERFIAEGANVIITDIDETGGTRAALALGDHCQFVRHDVSVPEHWNALFVIAQGKFSGLDILVNVAGVTLMGNIEELDVASWDKTMAINLRSCFLGCQGAIKLMKADGGGAIINMASVSASRPKAELVAYNASKAGVESFSRTFAREMADFNVRVNCIAPGPIRTDLLRGITDTQIEKITSQQVIQKQFQKSDVCDLVELLLDEKASSLSGQVLNVGGV